MRTITLFTANFSPLAGLLNIGFYLHTCAVPILRNAKAPKNNGRNLFIGYTIVFLSYVMIGIFGYIGFLGTLFSHYFLKIPVYDRQGVIDQNCLNMFGYTSPIAFVIRLAIFMLLFSTYPLLNLLLRTHLLNLIFTDKCVNHKDMIILNILVTIIPLSFAIVFPDIGSILAFGGAFAGFIIIYCLPVMVYLRKKYLAITNPLRAEVLALNEYRIVSQKNVNN